MAWPRLRIFAGRLRPGIPAGRGCIPLCLSALGMAAALFCRRIAGAAHALRPRQSERAGRLASFAYGLDDVQKNYPWELATLCLSRRADGHGEFHFAWHTGYVPHLLAAPARFQSSENVG